jgi:hypothetical protein
MGDYMRRFRREIHDKATEIGVTSKGLEWLEIRNGNSFKGEKYSDAA